MNYLGYSILVRVGFWWRAVRLACRQVGCQQLCSRRSPHKLVQGLLETGEYDIVIYIARRRIEMRLRSLLQRVPEYQAMSRRRKKTFQAVIVKCKAFGLIDKAEAQRCISINRRCNSAVHGTGLADRARAEALFRASESLLDRLDECDGRYPRTPSRPFVVTGFADNGTAPALAMRAGG